MTSTYAPPPPTEKNEANASTTTEKKEPVLSGEDEKLLDREISTDEAAAQQPDIQPATKITDDGEEVEASQEEAGDEVVVPDTQPAQGDEGEEEEHTPSYDEVMAYKAAAAKKARKMKRDKSFELPSQEEAEAATRGFNEQAASPQDGDKTQKRTWVSYLSSVRPGSKKGKDATADASTQQQQPSSSTVGTEEGEPTEEQKRTWAQYAGTYIPTIPKTWKSSKSNTVDEAEVPEEPIYNEDGTINTTATAERNEVHTLLSNLDLSSMNNRVFALSDGTHDIYERFAQVLKDIIAGAPTAYDDMDKLMREAGPRLEQQFKSMPPFVQTLVKSLPAKLGGTLGPELLAAASEKPGNDMKARMEAASKPGAGATDSGINVPSTTETEVKKDEDGTEKKTTKRRIPGLKSLVGEKSAVAGMLRSAVNFLQTRFPFLASTTNVVMSLAVFILMFVFWYCHKRGREVRLAKAAEGEDGDEDLVLEEVEVTDEGEDADEEGLEGEEKMEEDVDEKADVLSQPDPPEVPLPSETEKGAETEAEEAVGT